MIFQFAYRRYRLALRAPVRTAHGVRTEREGVIVRLARSAEASEGTADGGKVVGWGEAAVLPEFGTESVEEVETTCRELGGSVDAERLNAVPERLVCLRTALAMARAECGGAQGVGAELSSERPYLGVAALVSAGRAAVGQVQEKAESGFRVFKWKVGVGDIADELGILDDVCGALPEGAKLRLDANGAWDRRKAERWLERCAERPVEFVEQPIAADARGAADVLLGLAGDWPTPIALDESLVGERDLERWLGAGWPGVFVVKPSLLGDVAEAMARLEKAKAAVVFSSALETAVGARAALRVAFAWKGEPRALGFGVWPLFADTRCDGPRAAPFLRVEDVERIDVEAVWNAIS